MNKTQLVIATVAEKGGGKGFFTEIVKKALPQYRVASLRLSDTFRDILSLLAKDQSRENISTLATILREGFEDNGILIPAMEKRIKETDADIIILDGLRKPEEIEPLVRKFNGVVVYIEADQKTRFERRREQAETTDEKGMSWEQFVRQDKMAAEIAIRAMGETVADVTMENNGSREEFTKKVENFLAAHIKSKLA